tara:strand:- start:71 stop:484 length:414 start_codon:yes stop_codon:yes gene_type:complete
MIDLKQIPQDHLALFNDQPPKSRLISKETQAKINQRYQKKYLSPWRRPKPHIKKNYVNHEFAAFKKKPGFNATQQNLPNNGVQPLEKNAHLSRFPNHIRKAITISITRLTPEKGIRKAIPQSVLSRIQGITLLGNIQ